MDRVPQFMMDGDLSLTVPLTQGFDKILHDFVLMTASRSGFASEDSNRMAAKVSNLLLEQMKGVLDNGSTAQLQLTLAHRPGHVTITTTIAALSFSREEHFQVEAG
ncbi:MAG: hypothetical protein L0387_05315 [Acidobacteria bacterium]|nr:hypothetical protein [Acidobacteriota bacterium]MCI0621081.1 hypothetical protein [Acidobacteriota bacterium]MCI0718240.1 hypothetical protein [Acidobacteriota bacterium]